MAAAEDQSDGGQAKGITKSIRTMTLSSQLPNNGKPMTPEQVGEEIARLKECGQWLSDDRRKLPKTNGKPKAEIAYKWEPVGSNGMGHLTVSLNGTDITTDRLDIQSRQDRERIAKVLWENLGTKYHIDDPLPSLSKLAISLTKSSRPKPVLRRIVDIPAEELDWFFENWVPRQATTMLDGPPGLGKSTLLCHFLACETRGSAIIPTGKPIREPGNVLLLSAEDDPARTIRPRLEAAGADMQRVFLFDALRSADGVERPPVFPDDFDALEAMIAEHQITLCGIDPIVAYLSSMYSAHKDQDVRIIFHRLAVIAGRTGATFIPLRHLNKMTGQDAISRGGGSIAFIGAARAGLLVGKHPEDPKKRVLAQTKSNLGPPQRSIMFRLKPQGRVAVIEWLGECDLTADDLVFTPARGQKKANAETYVENMLVGAGGRLPSKAVYDSAMSAGFKKRTVERALKSIGVAYEKDATMDGQWFIVHPEVRQQDDTMAETEVRQLPLALGELADFEVRQTNGELADIAKTAENQQETTGNSEVRQTAAQVADTEVRQISGIGSELAEFDQPEQPKPKRKAPRKRGSL